MTLDTVISGCATYYFDEQGLDGPRLAMLGHCLDDLDTLLPDLPERLQAALGRSVRRWRPFDASSIEHTARTLIEPRPVS